MACASIDSVLYSRQTINIGFKFRGDYPTLEGLERFTLEGGALGPRFRLLRPRDAGDLPPRGTLEIR